MACLTFVSLLSLRGLAFGVLGMAIGQGNGGAQLLEFSRHGITSRGATAVTLGYHLWPTGARMGATMSRHFPK